MDSKGGDLTAYLKGILEKGDVKIENSENFETLFPEFKKNREQLAVDEYFTSYKTQNKNGQNKFVKLFTAKMKNSDLVAKINKQGEKIYESKKDPIIEGQITDIFVSTQSKHPNLLKSELYEIEIEKNTENGQKERILIIAIVSPFFEKGSLLKNIEKRKEENNHYKPKEIVSMIENIIGSLKAMRLMEAPQNYLAELGISKSATGLNNLNINCKNILISGESQSEQCILSDFSLGRFRKINNGGNTMISELPNNDSVNTYRSPEIMKIIQTQMIQNSENQSNTEITIEKSDIFSAGICMLMANFLIDKSEQLKDLNTDIQEEDDRKGETIRQDLLEKIENDQLRDILDNMTNYDEEDRCDMEGLEKLINEYKTHQ